MSTPQTPDQPDEGHDATFAVVESVFDDAPAPSAPVVIDFAAPAASVPPEIGMFTRAVPPPTGRVHVVDHTRGAGVETTGRSGLRRRTGGRLLLGSTALTAAVAGGVVLALLALGLVFPWMSLLGSEDPEATLPQSVQPVTQTRAVSDPGPSPAEQVVDEVMATPLPIFSGWTETEQTNAIEAASLGFGCDPRDGLAPVVGTTRAWSDVAGSGTSVSISARAYPAGAGAAALDGIEAASLGCEEASLATASVDLGVEAAQVESRRASALVWRRGDVLMVAEFSARRAAADPAVYADALRALDVVLDQALTGTCADQAADAAASRRSPYTDRAGFLGRTVTEVVRRPESATLTAEQRVEDVKGLTAVDVPAPTLRLPEVGTLPEPPDPAPTKTAADLPDPVTAPQEPRAPQRPAAVVEVKRQVADKTGPGCGWAFTGQEAPEFDSVTANAEYDRAVDRAERSLSKAWDRWQDQKVAYFEAYGKYQDKAKAYRRYATEVRSLAEAWEVIETARTAYEEALVAYETAVADREAWFAERDQARADYQAAKAACAEQAEEAEAEQGAKKKACPPVRPAILDEEPPAAPEEPTPAPEAELPRAD